MIVDFFMWFWNLMYKMFENLCWLCLNFSFFFKNFISYIFLMIDKLNCLKVEEILLKFMGFERIKICDI